MAATPSRLAVQESGRVTVAVDADINAAWDVVRDATRFPERNHERVGQDQIGEHRPATETRRSR